MEVAHNTKKNKNNIEEQQSSLVIYNHLFVMFVSTYRTEIHLVERENCCILAPIPI